MQVGDIIIMSKSNKNHLGTDVCAYAGMTGIVKEIYPDNSFWIDCGNSTLIVPMHNTNGVYIWVNGEHIFHKKKKLPKTDSEKKESWNFFKIGSLFLLLAISMIVTMIP